MAYWKCKNCGEDCCIREEIARLRKALERIAACDYRGNEPMEQRIAREALSGQENSHES